MIDIAQFEEFVNIHRWTFAKTYAHFSPHSYLIKNKIRYEYRELFEELALYIYSEVEKGNPDVVYETKFNRLWACMYFKEYKYWFHAKPIVDESNLFSARHKETIYVMSHVKGNKFERITLTDYAKIATVLNRTER